MLPWIHGRGAPMNRFEQASDDYGECNRIVAQATVGRSRTWVSLSACKPNAGLWLRGFDDLVVGIFDVSRPFIMERDRGDGFERLKIKPGSVYAIPWSCDRFAAWNGTYRFPSVAVPRRWVREFLASAGVGDEADVVDGSRLAAEDPVIAVLIRRLVDAHTSGRAVDDLDDLYCDQSIGLIVSALMRAGGRREIDDASGLHWRIRRAIEFVDAKGPKPVTLDDMALAAGLSKFHFSRVFKSATGYSPHDWVVQHRLAKARELLMSTRRPVADIAQSTGFASASRFGELFRKRFGTTPRAWREAGR
jgi:AraC family transcriptional regulator